MNAARKVQRAWLDHLVEQDSTDDLRSVGVKGMDVPEVQAGGAKQYRCGRCPWWGRMSWTRLNQHLQQAGLVNTGRAWMGHGHVGGDLLVVDPLVDVVAPPPSSKWRRDLCRSCRAPVVWAVTTAGKHMPVDADPHPDGTVVLTGQGVPAAHVRKPGEVVNGDVHRAHFASCRWADRHRKQTSPGGGGRRG